MVGLMQGESVRDITIIENECSSDHDHVPNQSTQLQGCKKAGFFTKSPAGRLKLVKTGFNWSKLAKIFSRDSDLRNSSVRPFVRLSSSCLDTSIYLSNSL